VTGLKQLIGDHCLKYILVLEAVAEDGSRIEPVIGYILGIQLISASVITYQLFGDSLL